ncbi:MAG: RNA-binding protein [Candidatus Doudnabacteria bacterium]|nr:RNA-binding protein [Candidatus Doudnabacteria bacterium]
MAVKLYIGNLSFGTTDADLQETFSKAGSVVSAQVITDKMTGRSRGFGFVEMDTKEAADTAIEMYHDKDFQGRKLTVNEARPREDRPAGDRGGFRGGRGGGFGGGRGGDRGGFGGGNRNDDNQGGNRTWQF